MYSEMYSDQIPRYQSSETQSLSLCAVTLKLIDPPSHSTYCQPRRSFHVLSVFITFCTTVGLQNNIKKLIQNSKSNIVEDKETLTHNSASSKV